MKNMINEELSKYLEQALPEYEKILPWKNGGDIAERTLHVLREYKKIADNSIWKAKEFLEDVKTQFKAIEIIVEGLTDEGLNHGQKRIIANHVITTLRRMGDRLNNMELDYSSQMFDRFDFFRSQTPEKRLYEERNDLKRQLEPLTKKINELKASHPELFEDDDIPF